MIFVAILLLIAGFVALVKGADVFVDGAAALAGKFGIPQLVIGLTIVAMGTSLPEAAVSITAGIKGNAGITVGNIVGSDSTECSHTRNCFNFMTCIFNQTIYIHICTIEHRVT